MQRFCKRDGRLAIVLAAGLYASACIQANNTSTSTNTEKRLVAEKPFASGGSVEMQLDGGTYEVRSAIDDRIRVSLSGATGEAKVELTASGTRAKVAVKDTPHTNFHATIEVPKVADLVIHLRGGDLTISTITGNKDVESYAGDIKIAVGDPNEYSNVDASVKAGDINAGVFGGSKSGLLEHFTWSGPGKYRMNVKLGAGNLVLRSK
jgi:DUF4097 and DUF4098 domain-containing protein YvlB